VERTVYLSDFGAAFSYDPRAHPWIEHVEVVAFGFLLLDLSDFGVRLGLLGPHSSSRRALEKIGNLCVRSREEDVASRRALAQEGGGASSPKRSVDGGNGHQLDQGRVAAAPFDHSFASSARAFEDVARLLRAEANAQRKESDK